MSKGWSRFVLLTIAVLLALGPLPASAGQAVNYAGRVISVDGARGAFVLQDVGPWRGTGETDVVKRTIVLTPSTAFATARRVWEDTNKFPGDYEESAAERSDLKEGVFVAVECQPTGAGCRALKLTLIETDQSS